MRTAQPCSALLCMSTLLYQGWLSPRLVAFGWLHPNSCTNGTDAPQTATRLWPPLRNHGVMSCTALQAGNQVRPATTYLLRRAIVAEATGASLDKACQQVCMPAAQPTCFGSVGNYRGVRTRQACCHRSNNQEACQVSGLHKTAGSALSMSHANLAGHQIILNQWLASPACHRVLVGSRNLPFVLNGYGTADSSQHEYIHVHVAALQP